RDRHTYRSTAALPWLPFRTCGSSHLFRSSVRIRPSESGRAELHLTIQSTASADVLRKLSFRHSGLHAGFSRALRRENRHAEFPAGQLERAAWMRPAPAEKAEPGSW